MLFKVVTDTIEPLTGSNRITTFVVNDSLCKKSRGYNGYWLSVNVMVGKDQKMLTKISASTVKEKGLDCVHPNQPGSFRERNHSHLWKTLADNADIGIKQMEVFLKPASHI